MNGTEERTKDCQNEVDISRNSNMSSENDSIVSQMSNNECRIPQIYSGITIQTSPTENCDVEEQVPEKKQYLKLLPLTVLVFYNVSGGPVGMEPAIRAAGNLYSIIGFSIAPLFMSLPEALITAELGSAYPHASGGIAWAQEAFGETIGLWCGYWNWISGATDNAIYPALFFDYLATILGHSTSDNGLTRFMTLSLISIILAAFNYTGLEIVGNTSFVICIISLCPFIILCIMGIPHIDPSKWMQLPSNEGIDELHAISEQNLLWGTGALLWRPFLNNLFWNYNSFDSAASFSCEIPKNELGTTYPRGIIYGLVLSTVCYLLPLLVATGATNSTQMEWVDGHLESIAEEIGGKWLATWTVFGVGISNLALFEAEMSADAYQLMGMAEKGYLPKILGKRSKKFGTPMNAIIVGTLVIVAMSVADFSELVEMLNFNYSISLLVEYAAFVKLRYTKNDVERPYRVPISNWGCVVLVLPPTLIIIIMMSMASTLTYIYTFGVQILGIVLYLLLKVAKERGLFEFENAFIYVNPKIEMYSEII